VQTISLGNWGSLEIFDPDEAGNGNNPALPSWLPTDGPYRAARLRLLNFPDRPPADLVAIWPDSTPATEPLTDAARPIDVILAQATEHFRCRVCGRRVNALYPEGGLPTTGDATHRWATHCPHCRASVDAARLHALALFPAVEDAE
jgi:hypothetical protein